MQQILLALTVGCLATPAHAQSMADVLKNCNAEASEGGFSGDARKEYLTNCIKGQRPPPKASSGKPGVAEAAKKAATRDLKDPYSAHVEVRAIMGPLVCLTVNAKNSYGAYTGVQRYFYSGDTDSISNIDDALRDPITKVAGDMWVKDCDEWEAEYKANHGVMRRKF